MGLAAALVSGVPARVLSAVEQLLPQQGCGRLTPLSQHPTRALDSGTRASGCSFQWPGGHVKAGTSFAGPPAALPQFVTWSFPPALACCSSQGLCSVLAPHFSLPDCLHFSSASCVLCQTRTALGWVGT